MPIDTNLLDRLRSRGEEFFTQFSAELMSNPRFMKAMEGALKGKEKMEEAASQAVKTMNIPTRTEFKRALKRIDALEREVAALTVKVKAEAPAAAKTKTKAKAKTKAKKAKKAKKAGAPAKRSARKAKKGKKEA